MAQQDASPVEVTVLGELELAALLLDLCAGAICGTAAGPLPGTGLIERFPIAGSVLVAAAWLAGFAVLAFCYRGAVAAERLTNVYRRLALVLLATAAASVAATFHEQLVAAGALLLLLGPETRSLWRAAVARRAGAAAAGAAITLVCAAFAVGAVDLLLHVDGNWEQKYQLGLGAFAVNVGLLGAVYTVLLAFTARLGAALLIGTTLYAALGLASLGKIAYMHAALHPLDLLYLAELVPQVGSTFGAAGIGALLAFAALLALGVAASFRRRAPAPRASWRAAALVLAAVPLLVPSFGQTFEPVRRVFAAAQIELKGWDSVLSVRQNGVLLELLSYLPDLHVEEPAEYSAQAVSAAIGRYDWHDPEPRERQATLIVYMIESLVDPRALGLPLSADPIPTIRSLAATHSSGQAIVPGRFGESASSEFELLTGMSTTFLPPRSVAFKQYVKRPLPSLPCLLKKRGYRTIAVQADPIEFYNRPEVYERLCFDRTRWLYEDPAAPRAPHGKAPADDAVVDAVIEEAAAAPAFVFAFPSSTHHPYNSDVFDAAELDVLDPPAGPAARELKHYLNAVSLADAAVGKLVAHFAHADQDVVIAVLGDHLPPLSADALDAFYEDVPDVGFARLLKEHSVPLVIWSNFEKEREDLRISLNFLGTYLLKTAGVKTEGFLRVVDQLDGRLSLVSRQVIGAHGRLWTPEATPAPYRRLIDDYRLLQHDVLFGRSYLAAGVGAVLAGGGELGLEQPR